MNASNPQDRLRQLPAMTDLLAQPRVLAWLRDWPRSLVIDCLRQAIDDQRRGLRDRGSSAVESASSLLERILAGAEGRLRKAIEPQVREAINATGIILHTGLGRAVFPEVVVEAMVAELKGYATLAIDRETGDRTERDELIEPLLVELTGAESATVVNNNAGATLLVLAALAAGREVIVSRGQLIEIGGSFRLPEVMAQSQAKLVEVGTTNRTHSRDYVQAISEQTAAILKVHPSNYRVVGFTSEVGAAELAALAHSRGLWFIDDLGAGALIDLERYGLPHETTVRESIAAGADVVLFSADKLIGAAQAGIIVGRKDLIARLRRHPLLRALRVDKTCLMVLERTLRLFRDPESLARHHPTYRMLTWSPEELEGRAQRLRQALAEAVPQAEVAVRESQAFLGSGALPVHALPSYVVTVAMPGWPAERLARQMRLDPACVFGRLEEGRYCLDVRTLTEVQVPAIAAALRRLQP